MSEMEDILNDIGLDGLGDVFATNNITPKDVLSLTDDEFKMLGIVAIGDRVRLREKCKDFFQVDHESSPVLKRLKEFQRRRTSKKLVTNNRKPKETRRIHIGWKRFTNNAYQLISEGKGGGIHSIDVSKNVSLKELLQIVADKYFPDGKNVISGTLLEDLSCCLATFTGKRLKDRLDSGKTFTLGLFLEEFNSSPVRLYLHTQLKSEATFEDDTATCSDDSLPEPMAIHSSSDEFDTGTPTITFNRRRRLRLNRSTHRPVASAPLSNTSSEPHPPSSSAHHSSEPHPSASSAQRSEEPHRSSSSAHRSEEPHPSSSTTMSLEQQSPSAVPSEVMCLAALPSEPPETVVVGSEDDEFHAEIQATIRSLENTGPDLTLEGIIKWWQRASIVSVEEPQSILVSRYDVLNSTFRVVKRKSFNFCQPFHVTFSGEDGDDFGGPRREFFRLLMSEICDSILQGSDREKFFRHDLEKLATGFYEMSGQLVAFSLLHGGPGIPLLHPVVFDYLVNDDDTQMTTTKLPDIEHCIFDVEIRERCLALHNASDQAEYTKQIEKISDWCFEQGLPITNYKNFSEKDSLLKILKQNEICYRVQSEIVQFRNGLNKVGRLLDAVKLAAAECSPLFTDTKQRLRFRDLKRLYIINWSPDGSNYKTQEQRAIYCLEAFLADCEGGTMSIHLEDVLAFWTGATSIPPLGFEKPLEISFGSSKQLPTAHTCGLILTIWRGFHDPDQFAEDMEKSITWAGGFHLV